MTDKITHVAEVVVEWIEEEWVQDQITNVVDQDLIRILIKCEVEVQDLVETQDQVAWEEEAQDQAAQVDQDPVVIQVVWEEVVQDLADQDQIGELHKVQEHYSEIPTH